MQITEDEHDSLIRLARYGALRLGCGSDAIPVSTAIRFGNAGLATITKGDEQEARITGRGKAFNLRTAT